MLKNKNLYLILGIIFIAGVVGYLYSEGVIRPFAVAVPSKCRAHILSINTVDVDIGQGFTKPYIQVNTVAGQGADCLLVSWTKEQLNSALKQGDSGTRQYTATQDLLDFGYITLDKFTRKWQIFQESGLAEDINQFALKKDYFCQSSVYSCTIDACKSKMGNPGYGSWIYAVSAKVDSPCSWLQDKCLCISKYPVVQKGRWSDVAVDYRQVTFAFTGISPMTTTVSGDATLKSAVLNDAAGNRKALIQWFGDLYSGITVSSPAGYLPLYDKRTGQGLWHFQDKAVWSYMATNYNNYLNDIKKMGGDEPTIQQWIDGLNRGYDSYLISNEPAYIDKYLRENIYAKSLVLQNKYSLTNPLLELDLSTSPPSYPVFSIFLDAEWVGIKKSVTVPRVVCNQQSVKFASGGYVDVGITVYNDGDGSGQINAESSCTGGTTSFVSPSKYQFDGKGSLTGVLRIGGVADGITDKYGDCTVSVSDQTDPSKTSSCKVNYQIQAIICNIGEKKCSPDFTELWSCVSTGWSTQKCDYGCILVGSVYKCADKPTPQCPASCSKDSDCEVCGPDYQCFNNRCMKKAEEMECKSCWSWLQNKIQPGVCVPGAVWEYKPLGLFTLIRISQDSFCPIYLIFVVGGIVLIILVIILLIRKRGGK